MAEYIRQQSLVNQQKLAELRIAIVGTGSIGSFTALALTKMGCEHLTLWDKDQVELHNVSNQFFNKDSIGLPKVVAAVDECKRYTPDKVDVEVFNEVYDQQSLDKFDVVIALTDNIEGRKAAFENAQKSAKTQLFIDGRMGGELFKGYSFNPHSALADKYYQNYIEGVENEELPCTARTIIYNVMMSSSIITSYVKKFVNGEPLPFELIFSFQTFQLMKSKEES